MKKIIFLFVISIFTLLSCSSENDDDTGNDDNSLLLGKWYMVSYSYDGGSFPHRGCSNGNRDYIVFSEPNNYQHFVYPGNGDCDYIKAPSGTWTRDGDILTLDLELIGKEVYSYKEVYSIDKLTTTTFSISELANSSKYVYSSE